MIDEIINCWEYKQCGREPGGIHVDELGICPASIDEMHNGINNGINGGRICWSIDGMTCAGIPRGSFFDTFEHCQQCEFYLLVQKQERRHFVVVRNHV